MATFILELDALNAIVDELVTLNTNITILNGKIDVLDGKIDTVNVNLINNTASADGMTEWLRRL